MAKPTLLWPEPDGFSTYGRAILEEHFETLMGPFTQEQFQENLKYANAVFLRLGHEITATCIKNAPKLKYIATPTTGLNHIDCVAAKKQEIKILSLKGETDFLNQIYATPEYCWAILLSLIRKVPYAHESVCNGEWNRNQFKANELNGKTIGLIGYGRVAKIVSQYAKAFGMTIITYDPHHSNFPPGIQDVSLEEVAKYSDIISIHADLNESSQNLCDENFFKMITKTPYFINTARGEIVDERSLLNALQNKIIKAAALDVLQSEYTSENNTSQQLISYAKEHNNLIITPHIAGATFESMAKTEDFIVKKLITAIS